MPITAERHQQELEQAKNLALEAAEFAVAHGAVRYTPSGGVTHLPLSLVPWRADPFFVEANRAITRLYNRLYHRVAQDTQFLQEKLAQAKEADPFIANLFAALSEEQSGKPCLYLNRNDCMPSLDGHRVGPKQVEMNLMASALGEASARVYQMHKFLYRHSELSQGLVQNDAGEGLSWALAQGYAALGDPGVILFLVPNGEVNAFGQRIAQVRLEQLYEIPTARTTLEELGQQGSLRDGALYFGETRVAIAYFRSGYDPHHYSNQNAWKARRLIEASQAVSVPSARTQLANTKRIQLELSKRSELERFVTRDQADRLLKASVAFANLGEEIEFEGVRGEARELARQDPDRWVLKPHREGGGNNFFGAEMLTQLNSIRGAQEHAYILMEKIRQPAFPSVRLVDNEAIACDCFTEMGFFGLALWPEASGEPLFNEARGYLLRTKDTSMDEGLVLGGYSFLDAAVV